MNNTNKNVHKLRIPLLLLILTMGTYSSNQAFAQQTEDIQPGFGLRLTMAFEDFREFITIDPLTKAKLKAEHSINAQERIQELIDNDEPVPDEVVERIDIKIAEARGIVEENQSEAQANNDKVLDNTEENRPEFINTLSLQLDEIKKTGDVVKIRTLVQEFDQVKEDFDSGEISEEEAREISDRLDSEANSLELINDNCERDLDTFSLIQSDDPDEEIKEFCSGLNGVDIDEARTKLLLVK